MTEVPDTLRFGSSLRRDTRVVVVIDVVESVRIMEAHEDAFLRCWLALLHELQAEILPRHAGRLVKSHGDGGLLVFEDVISAVQAALQIHRWAPRFDPDMPPGAAIRLRTGIHLCEVVTNELDLFGAGVNLAARVAALAEPGRILLTAAAREPLVDGFDVQIADLGEHWLKHVAGPTRIFQVSDASQAPSVLAPSRIDHLPGIAILPFASRDEAGPMQVLGHAMADELTAAMSRSALWRVISRLSTASCHAYGAHPALARVLGVPYLVSGSYRCSGQDATLWVELCDARRNQVVWAERFTLRISEFMAGQDKALHEVVRTIARLVLDVEMTRSSALPFSSLEDYSLYLSALALMHRLSVADLERSRQMIDVLQHRHPRSAEPAAMRSRWHALRMVQGLSDEPASDRQSALDQARAAVDRHPLHPFALPMVALLAAQAGEPLLPALDAARRAMESHPQEPMAGLAVAMISGYLGDATAFEQHSECAVELTPIDPAIYVYQSMLASAKLSSGKPQEAIDAAARAIRANATYTTAHLMMTAAQAMACNMEDARRSAAHLLSLEPGFSVGRYVAEFSGRHPPHMQAREAALLAAGLPP